MKKNAVLIALLSFTLSQSTVWAQKAPTMYAFREEMQFPDEYSLTDMQFGNPEHCTRAEQMERAAQNADSILVHDNFYLGADGRYYSMIAGVQVSLPAFNACNMDSIWRHYTFIANMQFTSGIVHTFGIDVVTKKIEPTERPVRKGEHPFSFDVTDHPDCIGCEEAKKKGWHLIIHLASTSCANLMNGEFYLIEPAPLKEDTVYTKEIVDHVVHDTLTKVVTENDDDDEEEDDQPRQQQSCQPCQSCSNGYGYGAMIGEGFYMATLSGMSYIPAGTFMSASQSCTMQTGNTYIEYNTNYSTQQTYVNPRVSSGPRPPAPTVTVSNGHNPPAGNGDLVSQHATPGGNTDLGNGGTTTTTTVGNNHNPAGTGGTTSTTTTPGGNSDLRHGSTAGSVAPKNGLATGGGHYENGQYISASAEQKMAQQKSTTSNFDAIRQKSSAGIRTNGNVQNQAPHPGYVSGSGTKADPYIAHSGNSNPSSANSRSGQATAQNLRGTNTRVGGSQAGNTRSNNSRSPRMAGNTSRHTTSGNRPATTQRGFNRSSNTGVSRNSFATTMARSIGGGSRGGGGFAAPRMGGGGRR